MRAPSTKPRPSDLIEVYRAGMRTATTFKLTFVVERDASPPVGKLKPRPTKNQKSAFPGASR